MRRFFHRHRQQRAAGQALVEFALAATLIFFLLAAAVDLGLIFFTVQGMRNAAQEGASYGSRWLKDCAGSGGLQTRCLDIATIRDRVRFESGTRGGIGNLIDLNNDGIEDPADTNNAFYNTYITADLLADKTSDGDPLKNVATGESESMACNDPPRSVLPCYIRVIVRKEYKMFMPIIPGFANQRTLSTTYLMPLRDSYSAGGTPGTFSPSQCTVPNTVGRTVSQASSLWQSSGFTTLLQYPGMSLSTTVRSQSQTVGATISCTSSMTVYR